MLKNNVIDQHMSKKLKTKQGVFTKMYFLPKIHKENTPLRPIVSFVGSPCTIRQNLFLTCYNMLLKMTRYM